MFAGRSFMNRVFRSANCELCDDVAQSEAEERFARSLCQRRASGLSSLRQQSLREMQYEVIIKRYAFALFDKAILMRNAATIRDEPRFT